MFAAIFASIFQFLLFIGALVILYQVFLSDWFESKRAALKESRGKFSSTDKIAQVKLVSGDVKDIEQFVTNNATYLSDQMVQKLAARIESLRVDNVILNEENLKKRIADLPQPEEDEEENAKTARS